MTVASHLAGFVAEVERRTVPRVGRHLGLLAEVIGAVGELEHLRSIRQLTAMLRKAGVAPAADPVR